MTEHATCGVLPGNTGGVACSGLPDLPAERSA